MQYFYFARIINKLNICLVFVSTSTEKTVIYSVIIYVLFRCMAIKSIFGGCLLKSGCLLIMIRKIIHLDMNVFVASVEQRNFPERKETPVVVGQPDSGRVMVAGSYEASLVSILRCFSSHTY